METKVLICINFFFSDHFQNFGKLLGVFEGSSTAVSVEWGRVVREQNNIVSKLLSKHVKFRPS